MYLFQHLHFACLFVVLLTSSVRSADRRPEDTGKKRLFSRSVYTYKTIGPLKIQADVYRHNDKTQRPVLMWIHGGALIMGSRSSVPLQLRTLAEEEGYVLVSLDYRLAPEVKLPEIVKDIQDGILWVRKLGPELFQADPSRLVVVGASAGGYLSLMSGIIAVPPPTAIVSYWGFGDIDGDWTTKPNAAYGKGNSIKREIALDGIGKQVLTFTNKDNGRGRSTYFLYLKQTGRWINEVSGFDPEEDRDKITPYCPVRNVTPSYPPTLFLHGTADKDVPVEQSIAMAKELKSNGVPQESIIIERGGHSLWGGDPKRIKQAFKRSTEFIKQHLSKP